MSAKEIVKRLRNVAADPTHRSVLLQEQDCLSGIIKFLQDKDSEISFTALEVVYLLALHVDNRPLMGKEIELLKQLKRFMLSGSLKEKKVAIASYTHLQSYTTSSGDEVLNSKPVQAEDPRESTLSKVTGLTEKTTFTFTIFIAGLDNDAAKKEIESILLSVKGIISIYCDLYEHKTVLRSNITSDEIIGVLANAGKKASLKRRDVISDDSGYFDECEDDVSSSKASWFGLGGLTRYGTEDKKKSNGGTWVNRIGKALYIF